MSVQLIKSEATFFSRSLPVELEMELNKLLLDGVTVDKDIEHRLIEIHERWNECVDTYIALFKFYFRHGRYRDAEIKVWQAMRFTSSRAGFRVNYRLLAPVMEDWLAWDSDQRHYLFCLKALGVIRLRQNKVEMAHLVLKKLSQLDPLDEIGGLNYLQIAEGVLGYDS